MYVIQNIDGTYWKDSGANPTLDINEALLFTKEDAEDEVFGTDMKAIEIKEN